MAYETQPGTMPHRVVQLLKTLPPGEALVTAELCERLDIEDHQVGSFSAWMAPARKAGAVKAEARAGCGRALYWSIGDGQAQAAPEDDRVQRVVRMEGPTVERTPEPKPKREPRAKQEAPPQPEPKPEPQCEQEEEIAQAEFDAWLSARTGGIVLTGVAPDEEGSITLQPEQVQFLRKLLEVRT